MMESSSMPLQSLAALLRGEPPLPDQNWEEVIDQARRHGVSPLLFWRLKEHRSAGSTEDLQSSIPPQAWEMLQGDYYAATVKALLRDQELVRIVKAFEHAELPIVLLKGAALAHTVYPDPALRSMVDLDLLIRREDREHVQKVLESLGYAHHPERVERLSPFNTEFTGNTAFDQKFGQFAMHVEPHWKLTSAEIYMYTTNFDMQALRARTISAHIGDTRAQVLAPEDMLAHVCLHLAIHGFSHLRAYVDILQLIEEGQIDWAFFVDQVQHSRVSVACYLPLWRMAKVWQVPVPETVLRDLRPGPVRRWIGAWLMTPEALAKQRAGLVWEHLIWLFVIDRFRDLIRLGLWLLFPGPAWLKERYRLRSRWQARAWVMVHPFIVLREGLRSLGALLAS